MQFKPSPEYPGSHAHKYDPNVLLQVAFAWQGLFEHSLTSKLNKNVTYEGAFLNFTIFRGLLNDMHPYSTKAFVMITRAI